MRTSQRIAVVAAVASVVALCTVAISARVAAVGTRTITIEDQAGFAAGELTRTSAHSDGTLRIGVELHRIALPDIPLVYRVARAPDGSEILGTGNEGRIYRLRGEQLTLIGETHQLLVSALAIGDGGIIYAGTLPEGRIYAIDAQGHMRELARPPGAQHVWALLWDAARHVLYAGTGPEGKVFTITAGGQVDVAYDGEFVHVLSLARDATDGAIYAGTSDQALVLRLGAPGRATVVADLPGNEVTALAVHAGTIVAAANEFAEPPATPAVVAAPGVVVPHPTTAPAPRRAGKGKLFRISASDSRTELLLASDDGQLTSVALADDGTVYAGVGKDGHIVRVLPDRTTAVWIDVDERQVLALDLLSPEPLFATGDEGAVYRVVAAAPSHPEWTSKALDCEFPSRFGALTWRADHAVGFQTRSGNVEKPDATWSDWSAPLAQPGAIRSPAARFLQLRATLGSRDSVLRSVTAFYLPQNQRAVVRDVAVAPHRAPTKVQNGAQQTSSDDPPAPATSYRITWKVDNADGDRLRFRIQFREEAQTQWRDVLRESEVLSRAEYAWDTSAVPDGWYRLRVRASDELANPATLTLDHTADSGPVLVDNHAPRLEGLAGAAGHVRGHAVDAASPLARLDYAIDGGEWHLFYPSDDLCDSLDEAFDVAPPGLAAGAHIVAVRATDAAGNIVTADVTLR